MAMWHETETVSQETWDAREQRIADLEAQIEVMRRERDDLRDILAGIETQATRVAASYRENIKAK